MKEPTQMLSKEQGELALQLLLVMQDNFPDNPELTIPALEVLLYSTKMACIEDGSYTE